MSTAAPALDPELARLRAALRDRYPPADALEEAAIDSLAAAYRRRAELDALEARVLAALLAGKGGEGLPSLASLCRYAARLAADVARAEERLARLRAERLVRRAAAGTAPPVARASSAEAQQLYAGVTAQGARRAAPLAARTAPLERLFDALLDDLARAQKPPRERGGLSHSASALALAAAPRAA